MILQAQILVAKRLHNRWLTSFRICHRYDPDLPPPTKNERVHLLADFWDELFRKRCEFANALQRVDAPMC